MLPDAVGMSGVGKSKQVPDLEPTSYCRGSLRPLETAPKFGTAPEHLGSFISISLLSPIATVLPKLPCRLDCSQAAAFGVGCLHFPARNPLPFGSGSCVLSSARSHQGSPDSLAACHFFEAV